MFKIFDRLMGKETNVITQLDFNDRSKSSVFIPLSFACHSNNDFADVYKCIKAEIKNARSSDPRKKFEIQITLNGKLNGTEINQEFKDLDSYGDFLENSSLIKRNIRLTS